MKPISLLAGAALVSATAWALTPNTASAPAAGVGDSLPITPLTGFANTPATSIDDLFGQTVLLEFFAYW